MASRYRPIPIPPLALYSLHAGLRRSPRPPRPDAGAQRQAAAARRLFSRRARSRSRLGARRASPAICRSPASSRRCCARSSRSAWTRCCSAIPTTMSAISPRPSRWSGRRAAEAGATPRLSEVVEALHAASRLEGPRLVERWLDRLDASGRFALLKLVTGGLRVGVSARLAKQALARLRRQGRDRDRGDLARPEAALRELFAWLEGKGERPVSAALAPFRPVMLAQALDEADFAKLDPGDYAAEWKWDGIRVQAVAEKRRAQALFAHRRRHLRRLPRHPRASRSSRARSTASCWWCARTQGSIAIAPVRRPAAAAEPQDRVDASSCASHPAFIRAYDLLAGRRGRSARPALRRAAQAAGGLRREASPRRASTCRRSSPSTTGTSSRSCAPIRRPATACTRSPRA